MRSGASNTVGIASLNGGMAVVMYCVGLEIGAIVWIGLVAVVLMGAYWDRSSDRPLPTMKDMALPPRTRPSSPSLSLTTKARWSPS
jgi:hypothetical protein